MIRDVSFLLLFVALVISGHGYRLAAALAIPALALTAVTRSMGSATVADTFATVAFTLIALAVVRALIQVCVAPEPAGSHDLPADGHEPSARVPGLSDPADEA